MCSFLPLLFRFLMIVIATILSQFEMANIIIINWQTLAYCFWLTEISL